MKRLSSEQLIAQMEQSGLIPVFFNADIEVSKQVVRACYDAGLRVFEFTNRGSNAFEVFRELVEFAKDLDQLALGVGTIFSLKDAEKFYDAGASFVVSPALVPEMSKLRPQEKPLWIPGCGTVSEVYEAKSLGAQMVKVFPGNVLGPAFVKSVKDVMPGIKLMPTGGVSPNRENLLSWFQAGVSCVGMGSQLISSDLIASGAYGQIQQNVKKSLALVQSLKK